MGFHHYEPCRGFRLAQSRGFEERRSPELVQLTLPSGLALLLRTPGPNEIALLDSMPNAVLEAVKGADRGGALRAMNEQPAEMQQFLDTVTRAVVAEGGSDLKLEELPMGDKWRIFEYVCDAKTRMGA